MFQNDFSFYYSDFSPPITNPVEKLTQLKDEHEGNSIACPYFLRSELAIMQNEIPKGWSLEIDESLTVSPTEVRVTIYNKYEKTDRYLDKDIDNIRLIAESVGGDFLCVSQVCGQDGVRSDSFFELDSTFGSSPIMIMITAGRDLKQVAREFSIYELGEAAGFFSKIK
jgi:hypothetical protein